MKIKKKIPSSGRNRQQCRKLVYRKFGGRCAYCGDWLGLSDMQMDHIVPLIRGSMSDLELEDDKRSRGSNTVGNLYPCCKSCNTFKGSYQLGGFRLALAKVAELPTIRFHFESRRDTYIAAVLKSLKSQGARHVGSVLEMTAGQPEYKLKTSLLRKLKREYEAEADTIGEY